VVWPGSGSASQLFVHFADLVVCIDHMHKLCRWGSTQVWHSHIAPPFLAEEGGAGQKNRHHASQSCFVVWLAASDCMTQIKIIKWTPTLPLSPRCCI